MWNKGFLTRKHVIHATVQVW